jgi:hypothetical protein
MASASASIHIPVRVEKVWALVGGFHSLAQWLPMIASSESLDDGQVRQLTTTDGGIIIERLQSFDNIGRTYSYSIDQGPFPVSDYLSTLKVSADGDHGTLVEWSGVFTPDGVSEEEAEAIFREVYSGGLAAMKANF